jgi:hypothetical protein
VHLLRNSFVPQGDAQRMLGFLGNNVGDHLRAAVANVLSRDAPEHLEQAVFADGLSPASVAEVRTAMRSQWQSLLDATVPRLHQLIDRDGVAADPPTQSQRVRIGLYMYAEPVDAPGPPRVPSAEPAGTPPSSPQAPRPARKQSKTRKVST